MLDFDSEDIDGMDDDAGDDQEPAPCGRWFLLVSRIVVHTVDVFRVKVEHIG